MQDCKTAAEMACKDITKELKGSHHTGYGEGLEVWKVHPSTIYNKKNRRLNKLLGISNENYKGNTNGFKN